MSYKTIARCAVDPSLISRVQACIAKEQKAKSEAPNPAPLLTTMMWNVATAGDVEAAYAYALDSDNPDPGGDEGAITDAMILANVQPHLP